MSLVLYVGNDRQRPDRHDVGSTLCLAILQKWKGHRVTIERTADTHARDRPFWLRGTPTLVNLDTEERWTGFGALDVLIDLLVAHAGRGRGHDPPSRRSPARGGLATTAATQQHAPDAVAATRSMGTGAPRLPSVGNADNDDDAADATGLASMWDSNNLEDVAIEEGPSHTTKKLSQDDFSQRVREMSAGTGAQDPAGSTGAQAPILEPLHD